MNFKEEKISEKTIYDGAVFKVHVDDVLLPNGKPSKREVVEHIGGVCIAAKTADNQYFMVRQYRYPHNRIFLEFPAGKKEKGEDPLVGAKRELLEETGYLAEHWEYLGSCIPTPAYDTEVIDFYYAENLSFQGQDLDPEEFIEVKTYSLEELEEMARNHEIKDAKSLCLLYHLYLRKKVISR
jgi:NTP pyrophosphohydrolases including oxidative damage repair enzymes